MLLVLFGKSLTDTSCFQFLDELIKVGLELLALVHARILELIVDEYSPPLRHYLLAEIGLSQHDLLLRMLVEVAQQLAVVMVVSTAQLTMRSLNVAQQALQESFGHSWGLAEVGP